MFWCSSSPPRCVIWWADALMRVAIHGLVFGAQVRAQASVLNRCFMPPPPRSHAGAEANLEDHEPRRSSRTLLGGVVLAHAAGGPGGRKRVSNSLDAWVRAALTVFSELAISVRAAQTAVASNRRATPCGGAYEWAPLDRPPLPTAREH